MASRCTFCCEFTYDSDRYWRVTRTARGIRRLWSDLCVEFDRQGPSCPAKNAIHFKTFSAEGPKLFAVDRDTLTVFYHINNQWHQYQTARDVRLGTLEELARLSESDDHDDDEDLSREDTDGKDRDDDNELGRQAKDSDINNVSKYRINHAIQYCCLFQLLFLLRLQFYLVRYRVLIH